MLRPQSLKECVCRYVGLEGWSVCIDCRHSSGVQTMPVLWLYVLDVFLRPPLTNFLVGLAWRGSKQT